MTLQVPFEQFVPTVRRILGDVPVFLRADGQGTLASAADPVRNVVVMSRSRESLAKTRESLRIQGVDALDGAWIDAEAKVVEESGDSTPFVAAVSYKTDSDLAGLWIDAFSELPTQVMVLRNLYDEFRSTGELSDEIAFEEFVRISNPNVVIVSPEELASFLRQKEERPTSDAPAA